MKVINEHLSEVPECKHDLKTIMREAVDDNNKRLGGTQPPKPVDNSFADETTGVTNSYDDR